MAENEALEFIPLHFGDKLRIINPRARLGIITLWSKIGYVIEKLQYAGVDLQPATSKIAVIGNLYGYGLPHLLRNLLYNPQIRDLLVCGSDRSGSERELISFFEKGTAETEDSGGKLTRILGTGRIIDDLVTPKHFCVIPRIKRFELFGQLPGFIMNFRPGRADADRIEIGLPPVNISHYPSEPRNHNIVKETPLEAWRELIFRLVRFGHLARLRKGLRQELQNVRVVITEPEKTDSPAGLRAWGFSLNDIEAYQSDMLTLELFPDQSYTYGNRIRVYFGFDALEKFAERLTENTEDRDCYLSLWDSREDIEAEDAPCLVSIFFRVYDGKLTLTATYRTHNAVDAWIRNAYGLIHVLRYVSEHCGIPVGPLTIISHSVSIDPDRYAVAERVAKNRKFELNFDPCGQFMFGVESGFILAWHLSPNGEVLHEYRSKKAERIQHEINRDLAVSDINHAIYVGRQLARAEQCLRTGEEFKED